MMRHQAWIVLSCGCALSCGGASSRPPTPGPERGAESPALGEAPDGPLAQDEQAGGQAGGPRPMARRADESACVVEVPCTDSSSAPASKQLKLPQDTTFLQARLPEKVPSRYKTWRQLTRIHVGLGYLHHTSFLDGDRLILAKSDDEGSVRLYDRASRKLLLNHPLGADRFESGDLQPWPPLAADRAEQTPPRFVVAGNAGVRLFDARSGQTIAQLIEGKTHSLKFSDDGHLLMTRTGGPQDPSQLDFYRRSGPTAVTHLGTLRFSARVDGWALSRDNRLLAISTYPSNLVRVFDLWTGAELVQFPAPKYAGHLAFSPDGRYLAEGGQGLLLVDLLNPTRRAYYSYYYNNINTVAFSPSGDALVTSSYDGALRIFHYGGTDLSLDLVNTLRHDGRANVYEFQFSADGNSLVSGSGDQTIRVFGGTIPVTSRSPEQDEFRSWDEWRAAVAPEELHPRPTLAPSMKGGHYLPPALAQPARPSRIRPGEYACNITTMYKLRDCTVTKTHDGHTILEFHDGNLLSLKGVLYDDGSVVRYEAWKTAEGIASDCAGCEQQPLHGLFRGTGNNFSGLLTFRNYYDPTRLPPLPESTIKFEEADDRYPLKLIFKKPLPPPKPGHDDILIPVN